MRHRTLLAALALSASPATADPGTFYVGVEGGIAFGRDNDIDVITVVEFDDVLSLGYRPGHDFGMVGGYDLGPLRLELDVAHKGVPLDAVEPDENYDNFLDSTNSAPGDVGISGRMKVATAMLNGLADIPVTDRLTLYGGGGYGRSRAHALGDRDGAWAWQWIAGIRYTVSDHVELGLKQRYFNSGIVKLRGDPFSLDSAIITPELEGEFRTRSLLASLIFKL